jgi:ABC-type antimicrobial peptide transport system, ATPase component
MIEIKDLIFRYAKDKTLPYILNGVSTEFHEGLLYSILGPSGSGKTTFLSLLGGLEKPISGKILFDGRNIEDMRENEVRKKHISYIFQNYLLFPYMTAVENLIVSMDINDGRHTNRKNEAIEILLTLGFNKADINRRISKLSGGQQQRVAIARSLLSPSKFILADEPTGNLDKNTAVAIMELLKESVKERKKGLIIVTHSELIKQQSDFSLELDNGKLINSTI